MVTYLHRAWVQSFPCLPSPLSCVSVGIAHAASEHLRHTRNSQDVALAHGFPLSGCQVPVLPLPAMLVLQALAGGSGTGDGEEQAPACASMTVYLKGVLHLFLAGQLGAAKAEAVSLAGITR